MVPDKDVTQITPEILYLVTVLRASLRQVLIRNRWQCLTPNSNKTLPIYYECCGLISVESGGVSDG